MTPRRGLVMSVATSASPTASKPSSASEISAICGIEVIGSRGMIVNSDNTGLGLQLRLAPEGERTYLTEMEPVDVGFEPRPVPGAERGRDAAGWMDPGFPMFNIVDDTMRVLEGRGGIGDHDG